MINVNTHSEAIKRLSRGTYSGPNIEGARAVDLSDCGFHGEAIRTFAKFEDLTAEETQRFIVSLAHQLDFDKLLHISKRKSIDLGALIEEVSHSKLVLEIISKEYIDLFIKNAKNPYLFNKRPEFQGLDRDKLIRVFNQEKSFEIALEIAVRAYKEKNIRESAFFINFLVQNKAIDNSVLGLYLAFLEQLEQARSMEYLAINISRIDYYRTGELNAVRAQALILKRDRQSALTAINELGENPEFDTLKIQLHSLLGDHDRAKALIEASLYRKPEEQSNIIRAIRHGVELPSKSEAKITQIVSACDVDAGSLIALADYYDKKRDYSQSFALYARANRVESKKYPFSIAVAKMEIESVALSVNSLPILTEYKDYKPIFIVGLPRSGTSIVERLCADTLESYSCLGESSAISMFIKQYGIPLSKTDLVQLANFYFSYNHIENERAFIDKMPLNFRYLGIIRRIFPYAKIIYCYKDTKRNAWSLYKKIFSGKGNSFSNSTSAIENYIDLERQTMSFWKNELNDIHEICNEELITKRSEVLLSLSGFLGREVTFQKNSKHLTFTASKNQLRTLQDSLDSSYKNYTKFWRYLE